MSLLSRVIDGISGIFGGSSTESAVDSLLDNNELFGFGSSNDSSFSWGDFISDALPVAADLGAGLFGVEAQKDQEEALLAREDAKYKQELELQRQKAALELRLAALKAQYAGGGGGGGGASTKLTDAQRLAMIQNQANLKQDAITSALNALQNAYGLGQR